MIECRARTLRMVAPAGSGKTQTIVERVLGRIVEGLAPERVLVLTFDRAARRSLVERLELQARERRVDAAGVTISTLNAFGAALLRRHAPHEPRRVADEAVADRILIRVCDALAVPAGLASRSALLRELFALLKNDAHDPRSGDRPVWRRFLETSTVARERIAELATEVPALDAELVATLFAAFGGEMRSAGWIDFDDQKLRALALLDRSAVGARVAASWDEVVVDEFQDINRLDFELVSRLASRADLVVTGDDDQAIYGFRGCSSEFILDLEARLGRTIESHELSINYRNPPNLLEHAVRLVEHNRNRIPKRPVAARTDPARVVVLGAGGAESEAAGVARRARKTIEAGRRAEDLAVLCRTNAHCAVLAERLLAAGVPCRVRADAEPDADTPGAVTVATYFRAKGLQWPVVFLPGCNEGVVPHPRASVPDERRLFYVALTRASEELVATWVAVPEDDVEPSRFLIEAGLLE